MLYVNNVFANPDYLKYRKQPKVNLNKLVYKSASQMYIH